MEPAITTPVSAAANLRRAAVISAFIGGLGVIGLSLAGRPLLGIFLCLGLALGALNNRLLQLSVLKYARADGDMSKMRFNGGVAGRLGMITAFSILIAILVRPDGVGIFAGLAVFQILILIVAAVPVFRSIRPGAAR